MTKSSRARTGITQGDAYETKFVLFPVRVCGHEWKPRSVIIVIFPIHSPFFFPKRMTRIKVDNERLRERRCTFGVGPTAGQLKQHMSKWLRYGLCHCVDGTMDARAHGGWSNESPKSYPCHYFATARRSGPACQSISRRSIKAANVIDVKEITFVYNRNYYCICYIVDLIFYQYAH